MQAALTRARKSARAGAAIERALGEGQARRNPSILRTSGRSAWNVAALAQSTGGRVMRALWRTRDRRPGLVELEAA
eukprot:15442401-Alexandrium_andersonii.AAC.1